MQGGGATKPCLGKRDKGVEVAWWTIGCVGEAGNGSFRTAGIGGGPVAVHSECAGSRTLLRSSRGPRGGPGRLQQAWV